MQPFYALDIETANSANTGICQIGIAYFRNGCVMETWSHLLDPGCEFSPVNVAIHGISDAMILGMPSLADIHGELRAWLDNQIVVSHKFFDRDVLSGAMLRLDLPPLQTVWLDSCAIARFAWQKRRRGKSFSLAALAGWQRIEFQHHDALQDAIVAGKITVRACADADIALDEWIAHTDGRPLSAT